MSTTYANVPTKSGTTTRVGFTADAAREYIHLHTDRANLGGYSIDRFGPDPLTETGTVRASAIRYFLGDR